ncbi:spore cortex biosynthesis protein YabQ [Hydrogenibacillus sp. N12]|uniref:spore cortex biosynthesis protein YabQ n=1 Tax=Hydrogenibacillus sp. N12 TaxID=2866627 RepID=UPI001C7D0C3F|nr:spore cortex biosynthesis protein YabQ [Hydrogenibacillus sp. N12]QZA33078.1 hypothetical protein K2M58_00330 [Hydrogenibacillus sp. N12]
MSVQAEAELVARALLAGVAFGLFYDGAEALFRRMRPAPVRALMEALAWAAGAILVFAAVALSEVPKVRVALLPFALLGAVGYEAILARPVHRAAGWGRRRLLRPAATLIGRVLRALVAVGRWGLGAAAFFVGAPFRPFARWIWRGLRTAGGLFTLRPLATMGRAIRRLFRRHLR